MKTLANQSTEENLTQFWGKHLPAVEAQEKKRCFVFWCQEGRWEKMRVKSRGQIKKYVYVYSVFWL